MKLNYAYEYLKFYKMQRNKYKEIQDNGVEILLIILQNKFGYNFNLNYDGTDLKSVIESRYGNDSEYTLKYMFQREYFYLAFKNKIKVEDLLYNLENISSKYKAINSKTKYDVTGYEITHLILAILFINKVDSCTCKGIDDLLVNVIEQNIHSDLKTEAIYILSLINPAKINNKWILELENNQSQLGYLNCDYFGNYDDGKAHHTALGMLAYLEYKKYCFNRSLEIILFILVLLIVKETFK